MSCLVSVITPAYNRAAYIEETVNSVLEQDYSNIEYIVLDDGSTDNTRKILERYGEQIRVDSHPNMGETRTVNKAFQMAGGDILCVVNSDDLLLPGAVTRAVQVLEENEGALVAYPDWMYIDAQSRPVSHVRVPEHDYRYMVGQHKCYVGPAAFFRRKAVDYTGGRDPGLRYVADFDFWLRLGLHGEFVRIPETLGTFRIHAGSASIQNKLAMAAEDIELVKKFYQLPGLPREIQGIKAQAYSSAHFHAALNCEPNHRAALPHYARCFVYCPVNVFRIDWTLLYRYYLRSVKRRVVGAFQRQIKGT